jgi:RecA-family ATPase
MRPAWMTVHEGGLRDEAQSRSATQGPNVSALCAARDQALRTIDAALDTILRIDHPMLASMRAALIRKLQDTRQALSRPAALLLVEQDLLRNSWTELQQALHQIQQMQADADELATTIAPQE